MLVKELFSLSHKMLGTKEPPLIDEKITYFIEHGR